MDPGYAVAIFVSIFAIVDPMANISFFSTLTRDYSKKEKNRVANKAILSATVILITFGLIGKYIFMIFSITIPAFRIAGGLLLFRVALSMLYGSTPGTKTTTREKEETLEREMVGIIPLGIPMLSGPGAISTVMIYISGGGLMENSIVFGSIIVTMVITYILFLNADRVFNRLGKTGSLAISRIMGLILATIAIQFIVNGAHEIAIEWAEEIQALVI
jgi:multiple antibiotic resistance protein